METNTGADIGRSFVDDDALYVRVGLFKNRVGGLLQKAPVIVVDDNHAYQWQAKLVNYFLTCVLAMNFRIIIHRALLLKVQTRHSKFLPRVLNHQGIGESGLI